MGFYNCLSKDEHTSVLHRLSLSTTLQSLWGKPWLMREALIALVRPKGCKPLHPPCLTPPFIHLSLSIYIYIGIYKERKGQIERGRDREKQREKVRGLPSSAFGKDLCASMCASICAAFGYVLLLYAQLCINLRLHLEYSIYICNLQFLFLFLVSIGSDASASLHLFALFSFIFGEELVHISHGFKEFQMAQRLEGPSRSGEDGRTGGHGRFTWS